MVNSLHTSKNRERIITREQTGAANPLTPVEQVAFYDSEIRKAKSWIVYYTSPKNPKARNPKMAAVHVQLVARLEMKREIALAQLYAEQMPDIGGTVELAKAAQS